MKVLVIGGTGIIGSFVVRALLERKYCVTVFSRGVTKRGINLDLEARFIRGDRSDPSSLGNLAAQGYDCVIDLACFEPGDASKALEFFKGKVNQYIFVSTVDVYTKPARTYPVDENAERKPRPSFPYALKKFQCEEIFSGAHVEKALTLTVFRPAHTYGEGVTPLLEVFGWGTYHLDRLRKGKPVILHGDGNALWSSCYAADVAEAIVSAVLNEKAYGKAYNLASEEIMTWRGLYETVAELLDAPSPYFVSIPASVLGLVFGPKAHWCVENFQYSNVFSVERAKKDLAFCSRTSFQEGAKRCLEWLMTHGGFRDSSSQEFAFYDEFLQSWTSAVASLKTCHL